MTDTVIAAQNLSKRYLVGHQSVHRERYMTLRDVIGREARNFACKAVDFIRGRQILQGDEIEEFWALQEVSFEVKRGEVLGIIGKNGAGKSTLLKILSRITEPDRGRVILRGRVASLLDVGTGFHPELTGRENIYLNGAILGMGRAEINRKFEEIVAFAEVERFLDTPVKRYSNGMYVRLAFSVAAHLEPEILIVDEVLAVGDIEFQKKCLGNMQKVASEKGRTVLFVSHNMAAIQSLTTRAMVLSGGRIVFDGDTSLAIGKYVEIASPPPRSGNSFGRGIHATIRSIQLVDQYGVPTRNYMLGKPLRVKLNLETDGSKGLSVDILLLGPAKERLAFASLHQFHGQTLPPIAGAYTAIFDIEPIWLASGSYSLEVRTSLPNYYWDHIAEGAVDFTVISSNRGNQSWDFSYSCDLGAFAMGLISRPLFERVDEFENSAH